MMSSFTVSYSTLTASVQSHCFNKSNTDPVAKNQNAVIFNTFKKTDSPHYLRLLLADWPRCGTKVATTHCWLQTKRTDSYAELSSRSAGICGYKSTYVTFRYSEEINPLKPELNPICYLLALLGVHHLLHVSRIRVKLLTFRLQMSYIYGAPILDVSRSHTTTQHSR